MNDHARTAVPMISVSRVERYAREIKRRISYWPLRLLYCLSERFRAYYWEYRAPDVHAQWGATTTNFDNLTEVIQDLAAKRILDFGCGSGRLLPLYTSLEIPEVVGYDVSSKALDICRERCAAGNVSLHSGNVSALPYAAEYFDLVICNRVLQHVPPNKLGRMLADLSRYAKSIYLCEMSQSDLTSRFFFMFLHDYQRILAPLNFELVKSAGSGADHWILFTRRAGRDGDNNHQ